ncbi:MAG: DUF2169 domain-containing protein, partial [Deltaproteobacteria bacterium]|nr:DUF2169 domain-containing protein [Deltaproteobacteria bacterium]
MKKIVPESLHLSSLTYVSRGRDLLALTLGLGFSLDGGAILEPASVYGVLVQALAPLAGQGAVPDLGLGKGEAEFMLAGRAFPPRPGSPEPFAASIQAGPLRRSFLVTGEEYAGRVPEPLQPVFLDWSRTAYEKGLNPFGIIPGRTRGAAGVLAGPQVYDFEPDPAGRRPGRAAAGPACPLPCPPVPGSLLGRGTFDQKWLSQSWPGFPADFDFRYFNRAQPKQRLAGSFFRGDEELFLENFHPQKAFSARMPARRLRLILRRLLPGGGRALSEVTPNLDTLWLIP